MKKKNQLYAMVAKINRPPGIFKRFHGLKQIEYFLSQQTRSSATTSVISTWNILHMY